MSVRGQTFSVFLETLPPTPSPSFSLCLLPHGSVHNPYAGAPIIKCYTTFSYLIICCSVSHDSRVCYVFSAFRVMGWSIFGSGHITSHNREIVCMYVCMYIQWGKKVFSQPPIVQVLPLKMRKACNFHHSYTSTMTDKVRKKNPENHIVGFLMNLFANYGGK